MKTKIKIKIINLKLVIKNNFLIFKEDYIQTHNILKY